MTKICRILIVEDEAGVAELLVDFFSDEGYRIRTAADGKTMREILASWECDVVILDLTLPGGEDGWSLAAAVRALGIPPILVTGDGAQMERLAASGYRHLKKPFRLKALLEMVHDALAAHHAKCEPERRRSATA